MGDRKERKLISLILSILVLGFPSISSQYSRLDRKINALEQKLFVDSIEFRENIDLLFDILNNTHCEKENFDKDIRQTPKVKTVSADAYNEVDKADDVAIIQRTLKREKQYLRKVLNDTKANVEKDFLRQKQFVADLENVIEKIETQLQKIQEQLKTLEATAEDQKDSDEQIQHKFIVLREEITDLKNVHLDDIHKLKNTVLSRTDDLEERQKTVGLELETLKSLPNEVLQLGNMQNTMRSTMCSLHNGRMLDGTCFFISGDLKTWSEASAACKAKEAQLATITSSTQNEFIISMAGQYPDYQNDLGLWLGATDLAEEGSWVWESNNKRVNDVFNNFRGMQPSGGPAENCLEIIQRYGWAWNDLQCDRKVGYLCEIQI